MNTGMQISLGRSSFHFFGVSAQRWGCWERMVISCSSFLRTRHIVFHRGCTVLPPTNSVQSGTVLYFTLYSCCLEQRLPRGDAQTVSRRESMSKRGHSLPEILGPRERAVSGSRGEAGWEPQGLGAAVRGKKLHQHYGVWPGFGLGSICFPAKMPRGLTVLSSEDSGCSF